MIVNQMSLAMGGDPKIDISDATITGIGTLTYNGQNQTKHFQVVYDGVTLVENVDYTISGNIQKNASSDYAAIITGINSYTGSQTVTWGINKGTLSVRDWSITPSTITTSSQTFTATCRVIGAQAVKVYLSLISRGENGKAYSTRGFGSFNGNNGEVADQFNPKFKFKAYYNSGSFPYDPYIYLKVYQDNYNTVYSPKLTLTRT